MKHVVRLLASSEIFNHVNLLVRRLEDVLLFSVSCSVETVRVICSASDVFFGCLENDDLENEDLRPRKR